MRRAPRPTYALRANPNSLGGWTAEGGTPVVVAQGESADIIAQRYGVPVATLLTLNGYGASRPSGAGLAADHSDLSGQGRADGGGARALAPRMRPPSRRAWPPRVSGLAAGHAPAGECKRQ